MTTFKESYSKPVVSVVDETINYLNSLPPAKWIVFENPESTEQMIEILNSRQH